MARISGKNISSRERNGLGLTPIFIISHEHKSWMATMWQPQPQNHRPSTTVDRIASAKKTKPALMTPSRTVAMLSLGSTGETTARSAKYQMAMWIAMAT